MKNLFWILLFFTSMSFAQNINIDSLFKRFSNDTLNSQKLKNFFSTQIENKIDSLRVTPIEVVDSAKTYIGTKYCYGGKSRKCTDCSGLLFQIFKSLNINLPHNSDDLAHWGRIIINADSLKTGDLVFFVNTYKTNKFITHSGIYTINGNFIHASTQKGVIESNLKEKYYAQKFVFGTRIFE